MKLDQLQPAEVFQYFEGICSLPHGSGNTKIISDYLVDFAKEHDFEYYQDKSNNVIIIKEASEGCENSEPLIIQGHMDMVCEKTDDYTIDFEKDGLTLIVEGDFVHADRTTLGGDDGIAIAYGMALLTDKTLRHPRIELAVTVDEEIGMLGAAVMDVSNLKGKKFLNIDSEEEGIFLTSCAGGVTACGRIPVTYEQISGDTVLYEVITEGLKGGHSGVDIDKYRFNSNIIMGRMLDFVGASIEFSLVSVEGGLKDNVIPNVSRAIIAVFKSDAKKSEKMIEEFNNIITKELKTAEPNIKIRFNICESIEDCVSRSVKGNGLRNVVMTKESADRVKFMLLHTPNGIQCMSADIDGMVETSLNLGILKTEKDCVIFSYAVRSSQRSAKDALVLKLKNLAKYLSGDISLEGDYPAWEFKKDSALRELMVNVYREQQGKEPLIQGIHAGLECGIFAGKIDNLDCVSFGPDIFDIHTAKERLSISSVERTWKLIREVIEKCAAI